MCFDITDIEPENARAVCLSIIDFINGFESSLSDEMQAGACLSSSTGTVFVINELGYQNPDLIILYGIDLNGLPVQALQHKSQINLLLRAVPRKEHSQPRRKIGFVD